MEKNIFTMLYIISCAKLEITYNLKIDLQIALSYQGKRLVKCIRLKAYQ